MRPVGRWLKSSIRADFDDAVAFAGLEAGGFSIENDFTHAWSAGCLPAHLHRLAGGFKAGRRDDVISAPALSASGSWRGEDGLKLGFSHLAARHHPVALDIRRCSHDGNGVARPFKADLIEEGNVEEEDPGAVVAKGTPRGLRRQGGERRH